MVHKSALTSFQLAPPNAATQHYLQRENDEPNRPVRSNLCDNDQRFEPEGKTSDEIITQKFGDRVIDSYDHRLSLADRSHAK